MLSRWRTAFLWAEKNSSALPCELAEELPAASYFGGRAFWSELAEVCLRGEPASSVSLSTGIPL